MTSLPDYADRYETIRMSRDDGILEMVVHTNGGPLQWGAVPHEEWPSAFRAIADDPENRVVIFTGTGDSFSGPPGSPETSPRVPASKWEDIRWTGYRLMMSFLDIEAPIISAINGPAFRHADAPLLADIVLAADDALIQDSGHFPSNLVPGDGMHVTMPLLLGPNRGRYFLLTGQALTAQELKELGVVAEVLPRDQLLPRARQLARQIAAQDPLVVRYSRLVATEHLRRAMRDLLGYGLALEGLATAARSEASKSA